MWVDQILHNQGIKGRDMAKRVRTSLAGLIVFTSIGLVGCGGGGSEGPFGTDPLLDDPPATSRSLEGSGLLGIISGGIVSAISPSDQSVIANAVTSEDGSFNLDIPVAHTGPIIIEITPATDGTSFFLCDYPAGCTDPADANNLIPFGDNVPYNSTLSAAASDASNVNRINVNPITTAVVARAVALGGVTVANLAQANAEMSSQLSMLLGTDFPDDISTVPNVNLVDPIATVGDPLAEAGVLLASLNAGLISLIIPGGALEDVIANLNNGFSPDGELGASTNFNGGELGSNELLFAAEQTISSLVINQPLVVQNLEAVAPSLAITTRAASLKTMRNTIAPIPPVISGSPALIAPEDQNYLFTPTVVDPDDTSFLFTVENLPSWASFDATTGTISGIPLNSDVGNSANTSIRVSDGFSTATLGPITITVENTNDTPVISGSPATTVAESSPYQFSPSASDEDVGDSLSFSISPATLPGWLTFNPATGSLTGTPQDADVGTIADIIVTVSDGQVQTSLAAFTLTVTNLAPAISGTPGPALEDTAFSFTPTSEGGNNFGVTNLPTWASFDATNGTISGTPDNADVGLYSNIAISLSDLNETVVLADLVIEVINTNDAPEISGTPNTDVLEDATYTFQPTGSDIDVGDTLSFSISSTPPWATFNSTTGVLSGVPENEHVGSYSDLVITVTDNSGAAASLSPFTILVTNTNDAPTIAGTPSTSVVESSAFAFSPVGADVDLNDTLTYSLTLDQTLPAWLSFSASTGELSGTPADADVTTLTNLKVRVTDVAGEFDELSPFNLTIVNIPPTLSGAFPDAVEDSPYSYTFTSTGAASFENLTALLPSWATLNTSTGEVTGTPTNDDVASTTGISIVAKDATETATLQNLTLTVLNTNDAPTISGTPSANVLEDVAYSFTPSAADVDVGDTLLFAISSKPSWATFNTTNGTLSGTPANGDVGNHTNIIITVIDAADSSAQLAPFTIEVTNTNDAPTLAGTPATDVLEDSTYTFAPSADDVDIIHGDSISLSLTLDQPLPAWLSFNTSTGLLTGSPNDADVGVLTNLVLSVTDGEETVSLPPFNLTVTNIPPTISGVIPDATEDSAFSFTPTASGGDSFVATNLPVWASINPTTGEITGTPLNDDVGITNNISIDLSDANETVTLPNLALTVINTNDAPTLTGTPPEFAFVNTPYSFILMAEDVDVGDSLIFTDNLPLWATLDVGNSNQPTITGTPTLGDLAINEIIVTASDTKVVVPTQFEFTLEVVNGTFVDLVWDNPTTNADGSPLDPSELVGFEITYLKEGSVAITDRVDVMGGVSTYTTPLLELGTYTFTVRVFDGSNQASINSNSLLSVVSN